MKIIFFPLIKKTKSSDHREEDCQNLDISTTKSNESKSLTDDYTILDCDQGGKGFLSNKKDFFDFIDEANHMAKSSSLEEIDKELLALTSEIENMGFFEKYESHNISSIEDQQALKARLQERIVKPKDYENLSKTKTKSQFRESSPS